MPKESKTTKTAVMPFVESMHFAQVVQRLLDSRMDTVGDEDKPKSIVETLWLQELGGLTGYYDK